MAKRGRGRPKGSFGPTRTMVVALFDAGRSPAEIARELGLSRQAVSVHLRESGRDPAAHRDAALRASRELFRQVWEAAPDLQSAARALRVNVNTARQRAARLRGLGVPLMSFRPPPRPKPSTGPPRPKGPAHRLAAKVERLCGRGLHWAEIARRTGASKTYVHVIMRRLKAAGT